MLFCRPSRSSIHVFGLIGIALRIRGLYRPSRHCSMWAVQRIPSADNRDQFVRPLCGHQARLFTAARARSRCAGQEPLHRSLRQLRRERKAGRYSQTITRSWRPDL